ncbi:MAG: hypothetical protein IJO97_02055 [Lachnospiraceae bacterium]|nr:hypothetical protein [Lachnospiraceae bacterium]
MYQKEIIYLSLMCHDEKEKNAGFFKIEKKANIYRLSLHIKNIMSNHSGNFPIRVQTKDDWKELDTIMLNAGCGCWEKDVKEEILRIEIKLSDTYKIVGQSKKWQEVAPPIQKEESIPEKQFVPKIEPIQKIKSADVSAASEEKNPKEVPLCEDKWEQLLTTYEKIHPYGDERTYIKLEPKDFIVLCSNYQHLVNNSFLLHGFYNYRYLILGKEKDFYIGVPGVFYEREKMVALMFGFEAFECEGGVAEEGKFGYYLRKVEL